MCRNLHGGIIVVATEYFRGFGSFAWHSLVIGLVAPICLACSSTALADAAGSLRAGLDRGSLEWSGQRVKLQARDALKRLYDRNESRLLWSESAGATRLPELLAALDQASGHGLEPDDYHAQALRMAAEPDATSALDLIASDAYLLLASHLLEGKLNPVTVEPDWTANRRSRDLVAYLEQALVSGRVRESLEDLQPSAPVYALLKKALAHYRSLPVAADWRALPAGPAMRKGDTGERIQLLRRRLQALGYLPVAVDQGSGFDSHVEEAAAAFQRAIGLEADGVVGALTLSELNVTPATRIGQLRANLERWRWLPDDLGERHIRVNIAAFSLEARAAGRVERLHDVIVGRTYRKTPVFSEAIRYVVLNPWWETPDSLARLDKLPIFQRDPDAVTRLGFEVLDGKGRPVRSETIDWSAYTPGNFPFRLRQRPGEQNALGRVKLMFPNKHNVYLHDTPTKDLFLKSSRAFSSGCVRVSGIVELTRWVLQETPEWEADNIAAALSSGVETRVNLARPLPVHILYLSVVMDVDGGLRFLSDVYLRDQRLINALAKKSG